MILGQFPGKEHLGGGIFRSEQVLKEVGGVMPSAAGIEVRAVGERAVRGSAIKGVTDCVQPRIVAAPLLPHEFEKLIGQGIEICVVDGKGERSRVTYLEPVAAGYGEG